MRLPVTEAEASALSGSNDKNDGNGKNNGNHHFMVEFCS
jgi:hypothetical protein